MGTYVFLGHGGFNPVGGSYAPEVLVPPDTSLRYFSDAGQPLVLPAYDSAGELVTDYNQVVDVWAHFHPTESPIPERWVTYNYILAPEDTQEERDLARSLSWGAEIVTPEPGELMYLCTGTADTCPTPALRVQQQQAEQGQGSAVPEERWHHNCTGLLKEYEGNELIWVACTSFMVATPELPAEMTAGYEGPGLGSTDWYPTDDDLAQIQAHNHDAVKATDDGDDALVEAGGVLMIVNWQADDHIADYVRRQQDYEQGYITVKKGGAFGAGRLDVSGIQATQALVRTLLEEFSDKSIHFG